jgi:hypothetical protein
MGMTPEQKARVSIDALLQQAGWKVCNFSGDNIHACIGVASQVVTVGPWFHALWNIRLVCAQIENRLKTTAGIYKVAPPELASITVALPPLAEQAQIVAKVDRHLSIIREVESEFDVNLQLAQVLRDSILHICFAA